MDPHVGLAAGVPPVPVGPRSPCPNRPLLRHLGGSAPLLRGWQGAEGTQAPPFWGATGTGRTRHSKASGRVAPGEPSGSAPPNKPGCKQSHRPSAFGVRPRVGLRTPKLCDTGEHSPEERGPTKCHRQPCPSWRGGPRRGCPREAPKRTPGARVPRGCHHGGGIDQGGVGQAGGHRQRRAPAGTAQPSPCHRAAGARGACSGPPWLPKTRPQTRAHPSTLHEHPGDEATAAPLPALSPPPTAGGDTRGRTPAPRGAAQFSFFFFFVVFPLKTKRLMPRSAVSSPRNTAQKHLRRRDLPWRI